MTAPALPANCRRLIASSALMNLADGIRMAALPLLAASLTRSAFLVAIVLSVGQAPWLFVGIWAGGVADRCDAVLLARRVAVVRTSLLVLLAGLIVVGTVPIPLLIAASFVLGVSEVLSDASTGVLVPSLVHDTQLEKANSQMVTAEIFGNELAGPAIGGLLFALGAAVPFFSNGLLLALAFVLLAGLPLLGSEAANESSDIVSASGAFGIIWKSPMLRTVTVSSSVLAAVDGAWFSLLVLFVQNELGFAPAGFGAFLAIGAVGGLVGAAVANRMPRTGLLLVATTVVVSMAGSLIGLGFFPTPAVTAIALVVTSGGFALWNIFAVSARQRATPGSMYGRVAGTYRTIVITAGLSGALIGGLVADVASIRTTLIGGGFLLALLVPLTVVIFSKLDRFESSSRNV